MTHYLQGYRFERRCKEYLISIGAFYVMRSGGSKGVFDLVAFFQEFIILVQCKKHGQLSRHDKMSLSQVAIAKSILGYKAKVWVMYQKQNNSKIQVKEIGTDSFT